MFRVSHGDDAGAALRAPIAIAQIPTLNSGKLMRSRAALLLTTATLLVVSTDCTFAQGVLTPPGAPAPTMKSLDQISTQLTTAESKNEARIAIETLPGDATARHVLSQPGSYYLRGNLTVTTAGVSAIRVTAPHVTVDLNGFSLIGPGATATPAFAITSTATRTVVRNGEIFSWGGGVLVGTNSTVENLSASDVGGSGVVTSLNNALVRNVVVYSAGSTGIAGAVVEHCSVTQVTSGSLAGTKYGIDAQVVRDCKVQDVTAATSSDDAVGIRARVVENCRVSSVTATRHAYGIRSPDDDIGAIRNSSVALVTGNEFAFGIAGGSIETCTANEISAGTGTATGIAGVTVLGSVVSEVEATAAASEAFGIASVVVRDCRVFGVNTLSGTAHGIQGNNVSNCAIGSIALGSGTGTGIGLAMVSPGTAQQNTVTGCKNYGIRVASGCHALNNSVSSVGGTAAVTDGAHIYVFGNDVTVEANTLTGGFNQDYGIRNIYSRNLFIRNRASGVFTGAPTGAGGLDLPEFNIAASCRFGPVVIAAPNGEITTTNPYANYTD